MSAYANAKALGRDAVLEKIAALDLYESGVYREKLTDHISGASEEGSGESPGRLCDRSPCSRSCQSCTHSSGEGG